jgi:malate dehydrogenase (oxaloacetate-decarboxylating)
VLYYRVLAELLPIAYDPTVGRTIERHSNQYRRPRGIFLSIDRRGDISKAFATLQLAPDDVDLIVCSDAAPRDGAGVSVAAGGAGARQRLAGEGFEYVAEVPGVLGNA